MIIGGPVAGRAVTCMGARVSGAGGFHSGRFPGESALGTPAECVKKTTIECTATQTHVADSAREAVGRLQRR